MTVTSQRVSLALQGVLVPDPIPVKRYACAYCRRIYARKSATFNHQLKCWSNPSMKTCKTCKHDIPFGSRGIICSMGLRQPTTIIRHCSDWEEKP
jgi:hypothetical protein